MDTSGLSENGDNNHHGFNGLKFVSKSGIQWVKVGSFTKEQFEKFQIQNKITVKRKNGKATYYICRNRQDHYHCPFEVFTVSLGTDISSFVFTRENCDHNHELSPVISNEQENESDSPESTGDEHSKINGIVLQDFLQEATTIECQVNGDQPTIASTSKTEEIFDSEEKINESLAIIKVPVIVNSPPSNLAVHPNAYTPESLRTFVKKYEDFGKYIIRFGRQWNFESDVKDEEHLNQIRRVTQSCFYSSHADGIVFACTNHSATSGCCEFRLFLSKENKLYKSGNHNHKVVHLNLDHIQKTHYLSKTPGFGVVKQSCNVKQESCDSVVLSRRTSNRIKIRTLNGKVKSEYSDEYAESLTSDFNEHHSTSDCNEHHSTIEPHDEYSVSTLDNMSNAENSNTLKDVLIRSGKRWNFECNIIDEEHLLQILKESQSKWYSDAKDGIIYACTLQPKGCMFKLLNYFGDVNKLYRRDKHNHDVVPSPHVPPHTVKHLYTRNLISNPNADYSNVDRSDISIDFEHVNSMDSAQEAEFSDKSKRPKKSDVRIRNLKVDLIDMDSDDGEKKYTLMTQAITYNQLHDICSQHNFILKEHQGDNFYYGPENGRSQIMVLKEPGGTYEVYKNDFYCPDEKQSTQNADVLNNEQNIQDRSTPLFSNTSPQGERSKRRVKRPRARDFFDIISHSYSKKSNKLDEDFKNINSISTHEEILNVEKAIENTSKNSTHSKASFNSAANDTSVLPNKSPSKRNRRFTNRLKISSPLYPSSSDNDLIQKEFASKNNSLKQSPNSLSNLDKTYSSAFALLDQIEQLQSVALSNQLVLRNYDDMLVFKPVERDSKERRSLSLQDVQEHVKLVEVAGNEEKEFNWIKADPEQFISAVEGKCARLFFKK